MYANLGTGQMIDLDTPSPNGVDLLYSHDYVANRLRSDMMSSPTLAERTNLFAYVTNNPINYVDPLGLKKVCGWRVRVYTGSWCVEENVWQAALDAAAGVVNCWWQCEVRAHQCAAGKVLTVTETLSGVVTGLGAKVPKVPGELLANQGKNGLAQSFRLANQEQLKALLRPYVGREFARSTLVAGAKGTFVVTALVEAGVSISCGFSCS